MFAQQTLGEDLQVLTGPGKDEGAGFFRPVQFKTCGECGDPDLTDRSIGREDELAAVVFEENVEDAIFLFGFEGNFVGVALFLGADEGLFEGLEGAVGLVPESCFVDHGDSVAGAFFPSRTVESGDHKPGDRDPGS